MCHRPNPTSTGRQYARTLSLILLCSLVPLATAPAQTAPAATPEASAPAKETERLQQEIESLRRQLATQRDEATAAATRLTGEKDVLAKDLTEAKKALGRAEAERDVKAAALAALEQAKQDLETAARDAQEKLAAAEQKARDLEARLEALAREGAGRETTVGPPASESPAGERPGAAEQEAKDLEARLAASEKQAGDKLAAAAQKAKDLETKLAASEKQAAEKLAVAEQRGKDLETRLAASEKQAGDKLAAAAQGAKQLETRLAASEKQAAEKLAAAEQRGRDLEARLAIVAKEGAEKLAAAERDARVHLERASSLQVERDTLARAKDAVDTEVAALNTRAAEAEAALAAAMGRQAALESSFEDARSRVPVDQGGTLTLEQAQALASQAAASYVAAAREAKERPSDATRDAAEEAMAGLRAAQYDVARLIGARGVYPLRKADTLAAVATRFYGQGNRWTAIFDANRHVLASPDQVLPGITVVVP